MDSKRALRQFRELKKLISPQRLVADEWPEPWQTLIAISLSAQTRDSVTIPIAEKLFQKFPKIESLSNANEINIRKIIHSINYHKTKSRNIIACARMLLEKYKGKPPNDFEKLIELPGVGHKTANVFLISQGHDAIGVDTHVFYISRKLGWAKANHPHRVEEELRKIFPRKMWSEVNYVLVRFGQIYGSKNKKDEILRKVAKLNRG